MFLSLSRSVSRDENHGSFLREFRSGDRSLFRARNIQFREDPLKINFFRLQHSTLWMISASPSEKLFNIVINCIASAAAEGVILLLQSILTF